MRKASLFICFLSLLNGLSSCRRDKNEELTIGKKDSTNNKHIVIRGSETMKPIILLEAEAFILKNPGYSFSIECKGSGAGIKDLIDKKTDIALTSRDLKGNERLDLNKHNCRMNMNILAMDALSIVTNISNPVSRLTLEQLSDIFSGRITNWEEVGGNDMKILVLMRDKNSGTGEFFKEKILVDKKYTLIGKQIEENEEIISTVQEHKGSIAFVGLGLLDGKNIKPLKLCANDGNNFYEPNFEGILQNKYPLSRPLFYVYSNEKKEKVEPFIHFMLSKEGQDIILQSGFLPLYN